MRPISLDISGFRSFGRKTSLAFPTGRGGFYFVGGRNLMQPSIGANGAGKSSLWDAVVWCLFGKTCRGLRASSIIHWSQNDVTEVCFCFGVRGQAYALTRIQNPNALLLDDGGGSRAVTQVEVDRLIGAGYEAFLSSVVMGQFNTYFFDLSPMEKLNLFSGALNLDVWLNAAKKSGSKASELDDKGRQLEKNLERVKGELDEMGKQLKGLVSDADEYDQLKSEKVSALVKEVEAASLELDRIQSKRVKVAKRVSEAKLQVDVVKGELLRLDGLRDKRRQAVSEAGSRLREERKRTETLTKARKKASKLKGECPLCFQSIARKHLDVVLLQYDELLADSESLVESINNEVIEATQQVESVEADMLVQSRKIESAESAHRRALGSLSNVKAECRVAEAGLEGVKQRLEEAKREVNPFDDRIKQLRESITTSSDKMKRLAEEADQTARQLHYCEFWSKEFKQLRLSLIDEALIELEILVNNGLIELGLEGWEIKFDVDKQTKAGLVSRGFTVLITSPVHPDPVAWECWSGGETQRLRLAGAAGLSELIRGRTGFDPSFEVWDEPTAHLGEEGIEDLLDYFKRKARLHDRQIWLVDHRSLDYGHFDGSIVIEKNEFGSQILQSGIKG